MTPSRSERAATARWRAGGSVRGVALCAAALLALTACSGERRLVLVARDAPPPVRRPGGALPPPPKDEPKPEALHAPPHYEHAPIVRVWLASLPAEPAIQVSGACRLIAREGGPRKQSKLGPARVRLAPGGFKIGDEFFKSSGLEIVPESAGTLRIENAHFPGTVRIFRSGDAIAVINLLDVESYLRGVLGGEMPPSWAREALKAQAVAARTYVLFFCQDRAAFEYDVTSTVDDQMYTGGTPKVSVLEAVRQTAGLVMLHKNRLFPAFYHSTCGGATELPSRALGRPEYDFIGSMPCAWCAKSRHYTWNDRLSATELTARLKKGGVKFAPPVREIDPTASLPSGEMAVRIVSAGEDATLSVAEFRRIVGRSVVRSGRFECAREGSDFVFSGHGFGHAAGLCQYGAKGQADAGRSYKDILSFYYHNVSIEKLY